MFDCIRRYLQFILAPADLIMIPLLSGYLIAFVNYPSLVDTVVGLYVPEVARKGRASASSRTICFIVTINTRD
jgi:hypothetical protein